ncbi:MAG TPA: biotin/lipoyl-containing protein, partial [Chloroflexota bacterium]|nr:biotin/lipoyl-containing protein [Chloroflexota bacterium]
RAGFADALDAARREAEASFGDGRVLLERYVARPRHIEVQVLADHFGNAVALGERECSIQRRYQKLIEESPSPAVDPPLRQAMSDAALRLVRAAGYTNAGTVEFLLDENRSFAFLEVNARLQVEHPVTEALTGLDLVEQQLRVASGDRLSFSQADVELRGHAIEARVVAEDPAAGFLPSTGRLEVFEPPAGLRVDSSVEAGSFVSPYYDSLLAKVIAFGEDRLTALRRLSDGLAEMMVEGVASNLDLLLATVEHPAFVAGELRTGFLAEHGLVESLSEVPPEVAAAAAAVEVLRRHDASGDPWRTGGAWRLGRLEQPSRLLVAGSTAEVFVTRDLCDEQSVVRVGDRRMALDAVTDHGVRIGSELAEVRPRSVVWRGRTYRVRPAPGLQIEQLAHHGSGGAAGGLTAPMPARVVKLAVAEGEEVRANQPLVVLEAMKMEHVVEAPHAGVVRQLCVAAGQQVAAGALLLELAELE